MCCEGFKEFAANHSVIDGRYLRFVTRAGQMAIFLIA
jgi:hypothetical protein